MISAVTEASRAIEAWEVEVKGARIRSMRCERSRKGELEAHGLPSHTSSSEAAVSTPARPNAVDSPHSRWQPWPDAGTVRGAKPLVQMPRQVEQTRVTSSPALARPRNSQLHAIRAT
ncbi:MAG: hypothetical protein CM1200mP2_47790 [Planctomycetaceae bacterium]|nr:MAG: hypothetical protein CM1200mP2_47790 [Planctomycetaceae bacterium]